MTGKVSRRSFLKGGLAAACTLAASSLPVAASEKEVDNHTLTSYKYDMR